MTAKITDIVGRTVTTLYDGTLQAGRHLFDWSVPGEGNAIYFLQVSSGSEVKTTKLMVN
jgi:hypothetical protein